MESACVSAVSGLFGYQPRRRKIAAFPRGKPMISETDKAAAPPGARLQGSTDVLLLPPSLGVTLDATRISTALHCSGSSYVSDEIADVA
jgi:hypothetical protein